MTNKQKAIKDRREAAYKAYLSLNGEAVSPLVKELAAKFKVTEVQIYNDIKHEKLSS